MQTQNRIVSGEVQKVTRVFELSDKETQNENTAFVQSQVLEGQKDTVMSVTIDQSNGSIITGSWDKIVNI